MMDDFDHVSMACEYRSNEGLVAAASQKMFAEYMNKFLRHALQRIQNILCTLSVFQSAFTFLMSFSSS